MPIKFTCPHCERPMVVNESLAGKKGRCKACQKILTVPNPAAKPPAAQQPAAAKPVANGPSDAITKPAAKGQLNAGPKAKAPAPSPPPLPPPPADVEAEAAALFSDEPKTEEPAEVKNIELNCPFCDEPIQFPVDLAGKRHPCPECKRIIKVPELVKKEPKDWRKADQRGPAGARLPDQPALEGAWGSAEAGRVGRQTLEEVGVIAKAERPRTLWQRYRLPAAGVATLFLVVGFSWGGYRWWVQRGIDRAMQETLDYAASPEAAKEIGPAGQAALYLGAGYFYLHGKQEVFYLNGKQLGRGTKASQQFGKAFDTLRKARSSDECDAVLTDLAQAWIELSGKEGTQETIQELLFPWNKTWPRLIATLAQIQNAEARRQAVRAVSLQLLARGEINRVSSLIGQVYSATDDQKAAALGVIGLELFKAGHKAEAEKIAQEALNLYPEKKPPKDKEKKDKEKNEEKPPPLRAEVVTLSLVLNKQPPTLGMEPSEPDKANHILGQVEGRARNGQWDEAIKKAAMPELNLPRDHFRAQLALAAAAVDGKSSDAGEKVENAIQAAERLSSKTELSWTFLRLTYLALDTGLAEERVQALTDNIVSHAVRGRAQLAIFRARLAKTKQPIEENAADKIEAKSLSPSLAAEDLARHNARLSSGWADKVKSWPQPRRAFGSLGAARAMTR